MDGSSNRFLQGRETRFSQTQKTICELSSDRWSFYPVKIHFRAKGFLSSALRLATLKSSYGETRVRTNKIREIEPNPREFLLSTLRDDEASDRVAYLSSPVDIYLSIDHSRSCSFSRIPYRVLLRWPNDHPIRRGISGAMSVPIRSRSLQESRSARRTRSETTRPAESEQIYFSSANMFDRSLVARRSINSR